MQSENHLDEKEAKWFAVRTGFKHEKQVANWLDRKGIEHYLPLLKVTKFYKSKVKHLELPLINCYIFVKITKQEYVPVLETLGVTGFVKIAKNLLSIPEVEMDILRRVVGETDNLEVEACGFRLGAEVEIIGGNLTGLRGTLIEQKSDKNFVIELERIGCALLMEVPTSQLQIIRRGRSA